MVVRAMFALCITAAMAAAVCWVGDREWPLTTAWERNQTEVFGRACLAGTLDPAEPEHRLCEWIRAHLAQSSK